MSAPTKPLYTVYILWACLSVIGAHRIYLGKSGWWYFPALVASGATLLIVGAAPLAALVQLAIMGLWVYDAANIPGWAAARAERAAS